MHLIYANSYTSARVFALHHDLMPGDWKWINDPAVIRAHPRADVYKAPRWETHPHRDDIDTALTRAAARHRLGAMTDLSGPPVW
ncbi:MAG: hypothetical protein ACTHKZ_00730 [Lysobacteraceae bacterium]